MSSAFPPPSAPGGPPGAGAIAPPGAERRRDGDRIRIAVGCGCYTVGVVAGAVLLFLLFVLYPAASGVGPQTFAAMAVGAVLAFPAALVYLTVPRLLDRYDPEPLYALALALLWGGVAACGISALVNTLVGDGVGHLTGQPAVGAAVGAVISAPFVEEATKGLFILGVFLFLRREFDGIVDGIIYATFVAIGFAAVENVIYYANAGLQQGAGGVAVTFFLRGVLTPWGHPLYTSMTGIGIGIARETDKVWLRVLAPVVGYGGAVFLHMVWNGTSVFLGAFQPGVSFAIFLLALLLWLLFVLAFLVMVVVLVRRRGRIIRQFLLDEVALGHLSQAEVDVVTSPFGIFAARMAKGSKGVEFVRAVARLALSKWHSARAMRTQTRTVSMDFIQPLRRKIEALRAQGASPAR